MAGTGCCFRPATPSNLAGQINTMLANPDDAVEMGRHGREQVDTINSPQSHYEQTMAAYTRQWANHNRKPRPACRHGRRYLMGRNNITD